MKRRIVCLLVLAFVLAGCQTAANTQTDPNMLSTVPTQSQPTTPTTQPTDPTVKPTEPTVLPTTPTVEPTEPTVLPTTPTVEPTEPVNPELQALLYSQGSWDALAFVHEKGRDPYFEFTSAVDISNLKEGSLYIHHKQEDKIYLIADTCAEVGFSYAHRSTMDHIYYVPAHRTSVVIRSDLYGTEQTEIYKSDRTVNNIQYWGVDANGTLYVLEDFKRVIKYDIPTGQSEVVLEYAYIERANYIGKTWTERDYFFWDGKLEADSEPSCYLTYLDNGEIVELGLL